MLGGTRLEVCDASATSLAQIGEESGSIIMSPSLNQLAVSDKGISPCQPMM